MGVITVTDIDYGHIFGPFPTHVTPADPAYLIGMLTNDRKPEALMLKMDPGERREGSGCVDWLPYIQPARDSDEQNMEAYVKEGQVYFRALRIIRAGEELLVWYSKDFAQLLHIPELTRSCAQDGEQYICPRCGDTFEFPYTLRAHIKFRCTYTLAQGGPGRASDKVKAEDSDTGLHYRVKPSVHMHHASKASTDMRDSSHDIHTDIHKTKHGLDFSKPSNGLDLHKAGKGSHYHDPRNGLDFSKPDQCTDYTKFGKGLDFSKSKTGQDISKPFPRYSETQALVTHTCSGIKRAGSDVSRAESTSPKSARVLEPKAELLSPRIDEHRSLLAKPNLSPQKSSPETSLKDGHCDIASAFRKVERSASPECERPNSGGSCRAEDNSSVSPASSGLLVSMSTPLPLPSHTPISSMSRLSGSTSTAPGLPAMPGSLMGLYMPRLPLLPPPLSLPATPIAGPIHPVHAHHPAFAAADQIPPGLLEMCRATIPSIGPLTESFANVRNGDSHALPSAFPAKSSMMLGGGERGGPAVSVGSVPFLKFQNPMVEKILQSTSPTLMASPMSAVSLSQNWCAKCNATFRMTSDLVYHMRSHHKREFDPMKRKREEKLKCTICNETFRERHHLTRHMSSHA